MKKIQKTGHPEANENKNNVTDPTVLGNNGESTGNASLPKSGQELTINEKLENSHISLAEQEETNSASEDSPQLIYIRVHKDTFETEPKSRMRKWFDGLCVRVVIAYTIITNFFRKK